jgi:signal peptidase I
VQPDQADLGSACADPHNRAAAVQPATVSASAGPNLLLVLFGICLAALLGSYGVVFTTSSRYIADSDSMGNTIMSGDIVFVERTGQVHRGDILVEEQQAGDTNGIYIRRVVGLPGDQVVCCDVQGRITVNGKPLNETYLYPGDKPSLTRFNVTVPAGATGCSATTAASRTTPATSARCGSRSWAALTSSTGPADLLRSIRQRPSSRTA